MIGRVFLKPLDSGVPVHHAPAVQVYDDSLNEDILEAQLAFWTAVPPVPSDSFSGTFSQANNSFISAAIANAQAFKDTRNLLGLHSISDNDHYGWEGMKLALKRGRAVLTDYFLAKRSPTIDAGSGYSVSPGGGVTFIASNLVDPDSITWNSNATYYNNGGGIASVDWDLDNDGSFINATGSVTGVSHAGLVALNGYTETGVTIVARVTDDEGKTATDTSTLKIYSDPTASVQDGAVGTPGSWVQLYASASVDQDSYQAGNGTGIVSHVWDLDNDGQYDDASALNPIVARDYFANTQGCSETGVTVSVKVTDNEGVTATDDALVKIFSDPTVSAGATYTTLKRNQTLYLNGSGADADGGGISSYAWDLDNDGQYDDATTASPDVSYDTLTNLGLSAGNTYTVSLQGTDNDGVYAGQATDSFTLTMDSSYNIAPQSTVTASSYLYPGTEDMQPSNLVDGGKTWSLADGWTAGTSDPTWFKLEWDEEILFDELTLYSIGYFNPAWDAYTVSDFLIQIWDDATSSWVTVETVVDNTDELYIFDSATAYSTDAIRVYITEGNILDGYARVMEVEVGNYGGIQQIPEPVTMISLALGGACCIRRKK